MYENPRTILNFDSDTTGLVRTWVKKIQNDDPGDVSDDIAQAEGEIALSVNPDQRDAVIAFFNLLLKGTTHYRNSEYVLRRTQTASNSYTGEFDVKNTNRLYTTEQILAETTIPASIVFKIQNIEVPPPQDDYFWGWLKGTPQISTVAGGKIQCTQDYTLEQWSIYPYLFKA